MRAITDENLERRFLSIESTLRISVYIAFEAAAG